MRVAENEIGFAFRFRRNSRAKLAPGYLLIQNTNFVLSNSLRIERPSVSVRNRVAAARTAEHVRWRAFAFGVAKTKQDAGRSGVPPRGSPDASEDDPVARLPRPEGAASGDARGIYRTTCVQPDQRPARPEARICHDARGFLKSRRENKMRSFGGAERAGVRSRGGVAHERDALPSRLTHLRTRAKSGSGESDEPALAVSKCLDGGIFPSEKSFCFARFCHGRLRSSTRLYIKTATPTSTGRLKPNETSSSCVQYCVLPRALDVRGETLSPRTESRVFPCSPLIDILALVYVVRVTRTPAR